MIGRLVVFCLAVVSFSAFAQKSLLLVRNGGAIKAEMPVVQIVGNDYIVMADLQKSDNFKSGKIQFEVLDNDIEGKDYFLVYPFKNNPGEFAP